MIIGFLKEKQAIFIEFWFFSSKIQTIYP